jgi:hypothetical protein
MFQGLLYFIFLEELGDLNSVWKYNLMEDAWERLDVPIPSDLHDPKLVVSTNWLFLVAVQDWVPAKKSILGNYK